MTREEVRHLGAPPRELGARNLRVLHLVGDVVHLAAEGVKRRDRPAPLGGEEEEAVVEARAARGRLLLAILVGGQMALAAIATQSHAFRTGRLRKTSPCAASILSRMRSPPWTVARISSPTRPRRR